MFYKLKMKDWLYLTALVIITYFWIQYDQEILFDTSQRMIAFIILGLLLMFLFYVLVKPEKPFLLGNTMTVILIPIFIVLSIALHVLVFKDGFQNKSIVLWLITAGMIYLSGFLYKIFRK